MKIFRRTPLFHSNRSHQKGMTLIELLITIAILGSLTILTTQSILQGIKSKQKTQANIDNFSLIRDTLNIMRQDIEKAFHHKDIDADLKASIKKNKNYTPGKQGQPPPPPTDNAKKTQPKSTTHFIGNEDRLDFVTLNHKNVNTDTPQNNYLEVGYYVDDCRSQDKQDKTSPCLWRRSNPIVDDDVEKGGRSIVLLENVSEFELRYLGKGKSDWTDQWRTDIRGDGATKNRFPDAVEISLTVKEKDNEKAKKHSFQITVPIRFPNNSR